MRARLLFPLLALPYAALAVASCTNGVTPTGPSTQSGLGVGVDCDATHACRAGLKCDPSPTGKCAPGGSLANGDACTIGPECSSGECGPKGTCDPVGSALAGASCGGDADCATGLRCGFDGSTMFPKCLTAGTGDVGATCTSSKDCFQGLFCDTGTGVCTKFALPPGVDAPAHGIPPYVPPTGATPFTGATCAAASTGDVTALWTFPRSGDAQDFDFYKMPFPNDALRKTDGTVDFSNHPHDPKAPMGFDAVKLYLDALSKEPFGAYPTVFFRFDGDIDSSSIVVLPNDPDPMLRLVDVTEGDPAFGQEYGWGYFTTNGRNKYICPTWLALRTNLAVALTPGHTYSVMFKTGVKSSKGDLVKSSADFQSMLGAAAPAGALADAYASYKPLRDYLTKKTIPAANVLVATVFTVGHVRDTALKLRASVRAAPAPTVATWVKCDAGTASPCPSHDGDRGCPATPSATFDEYHSLIDLPIFQSGTAPYLTAADGGAMDTTASPIAPVRTEKVCAAITVPKGTVPAAGFPLVVYAHGTGGSFRSHATDGSAAMMTAAGFAVLGIDQIGHGPRACGGVACTTQPSPNDIVYDFANPQAARFNMLQGAADQHTLARVAEALVVDSTAGVKTDPTKVYFWGHSQGATEGALFLAGDASLKGAILSGEGAGLIHSLLSKTNPVDIKDSLWIALSEDAPGSVDVWHPVLSLLQSWVDPADPLNLAPLVSQPTGNATPVFARNVFQPSGINDTYTPKDPQLVFAAAAGLAFVTPYLDDSNVKTVASAQGNVVVGTAKATAAVRQYSPSGYDGHFVAFQNPDAQKDVTQFLVQIAAGKTPVVPAP